MEVKRQAELAHAMTDDPDPNLAVAEGLPLLRAVAAAAAEAAKNDRRESCAMAGYSLETILRPNCTPEIARASKAGVES